MTDAAIKAALDAATKRICICDGECYETRHGMMHGPCEGEPSKAAAAIAAFLRRAADVHAGCYGRMEPRELLKHIAAAVERAAGGGDE